MPKKIFYFPSCESERRETLKQLRNMENGLDARSAYCDLRFAARNRCSTRDELVAYAWDESLVPYLRFFLERQGWLDEDWDTRIDQISRQFRREVN